MSLPPPSQPRKTSKGLIAIIVGAGLLSATATLGGIWFSVRDFVEADPLRGVAVGDCLEALDGELTGETPDCSDPDTYSLVVSGLVKPPAECPAHATYFETMTWFGLGREPERRACLAPNLLEGACYSIANEEIDDFYVDPCDVAEFQVMKVAATTITECAPDEEIWAFPELPRTYCIYFQ